MCEVYCTPLDQIPNANLKNVISRLILGPITQMRYQQGDNYTHGQARQIPVQKYEVENFLDLKNVKFKLRTQTEKFPHFESMPLKLSYAPETPVARRSKLPMTSEMEETTREELYTMVEGALPGLVGRKIIEHITMIACHTLGFELTPRWYIISSSPKQPKEETLDAVRQVEVKYPEFPKINSHNVTEPIVGGSAKRCVTLDNVRPTAMTMIKQVWPDVADKAKSVFFG